MFVWLNNHFRRWRRNEDGVMAIEFGLMLPMMLAVIIALIEIGLLYYDTTMVKKGMRAGTQYAARSLYTELDPPDALLKARIDNIVKCGDADDGCTTATFYMPGWGDCSTCIELSVADETLASGSGADVDVSIITLTALVDYTTFFQGFFGGTFGAIKIYAHHQQVHIGM